MYIEKVIDFLGAVVELDHVRLHSLQIYTILSINCVMLICSYSLREFQLYLTGSNRLHYSQNGKGFLAYIKVLLVCQKLFKACSKLCFSEVRFIISRVHAHGYPALVIPSHVSIEPLLASLLRLCV